MMINSICRPLACALMATLIIVAPPARAQASAQPMAPQKAAQPAGVQTPQATEQSRAQALFGDVNPKLAELTDNVLFGDIWKRPGLSPRDRSLVTVSALVAMNRPDQLRSHLQRARDNGLSEGELIEAITHLAFYAGWPSAVAASVVAKEVFQKK
jgi:4-carboxymuconolactone decarboxylase